MIPEAPSSVLVRWLDRAGAAVLLSLGLAVYWPVNFFSFFWEDPFDIGQVEPYNYWQLWGVPNSNSYYRPLTLVLLKALKLGRAVYPAWPYHLFVVSGHLLSTMLLFGLARFLFRSRGVALTAGLIYLLYPVSFEAVARAISPHPWLAVATFGALWLFAWGRCTGRNWPLWAALVLMAAAQTTHENGLLFPGLALALELWLVWQRRVTRFRPWVLVYFLPAILFLLLWLRIPKPEGLSPNLGFRPYEALYLSQGLSFPVAGVLAQLGGLGLSREWQAGAALLVTLLLLLLAHGREHLPRLGLALAWWVVAASLAWLTRSFDYLSISPRLLYFASFGAALAWAGLLDAGEATDPATTRRQFLRRGISLLALAALVLQSAFTLSRSIALYRAGSELMEQIIARGAAAGPGGRLLFVNVPDRFVYRRPLYPLGYWGMLLAPVSQDLSDFVSFASGVRMDTRSLSDFPLLAGPLSASPYAVSTRGSDAHATAELYDSILWAKATLLTNYWPDGRLTLFEVGDIGPAGPETGAAARATFGGTARLVGASAEVNPAGSLHLTLYWQAMASSLPNDTAFVHLFDAQGALVAQADGDGLAGLAPLSAWRAGDLIRDERMLVLPEELPLGEYTVTVGLYNRVSGQRYPAFTTSGRRFPDDEAMLLTLEVK